MSNLDELRKEYVPALVRKYKSSSEETALGKVPAEHWVLLCGRGIIAYVVERGDHSSVCLGMLTDGTMQCKRGVYDNDTPVRLLREQFLYRDQLAVLLKADGFDVSTPASSARVPTRVPAREPARVSTRVPTREQRMFRPFGPFGG